MLLRRGLALVLLTACLVAATPVPTPVDPPAGKGALAPNLASDGNGIWLTWLEPTTTATKGPHRLMVSLWNGRAWSRPEKVVESEKIVANWADVPALARGPRGLVATWAERSAGGRYAYDVILGAGAAGRWKRIGPAHDDGTSTEHGFVSLVPARDGVWGFWLDGRRTARDEGPMTLRAGLIRGEAIAEPAELDARVCDCCATSAAMTRDGPIVAYRDREAGEVRDIGVVRRTASGWSAPRRVANDGWSISGCPVNGPAIDARDRAVAVAWFTGAGGGEVRAAFSEDGGETFGAPVRVDDPAGAPPLGRVDVVLDGAGAALVTWFGGAGTDGRAPLLVRRAGRDGRRGAPLELARVDAGRASGFARAAANLGPVMIVWREVGPPARLRAVRIPREQVPPLTAAPGKPEAPAAAAAPDLGAYRATTLDGRPVGLADVDAKVVLVHLWAAWCKPCRDELPEVAKLHRAWAGKGLAVVGIDVDGSAEATGIARTLPYTVWRDREGVAAKVFGHNALPASFLVTREGRVLWKRIGAIAPDDLELRSALARALAEGG